MAFQGFLNKVAGETIEDQMADKIGDFAKQGAKVVIDKIQGGGADGEGGAGGAGGEGQEDDKDKGNLLSGFLGGNDDKKEGDGGFGLGDIGNLASNLMKQ